MKKTVFAGMAVVMCLLLGSTAAFAAELPSREGFGLGGMRGEAGSFMSDFRSDMELRMAEMKETVTDMSAYEQYGLVFDEAKGGWCYDGKLVGLFVDPQGRGISYLNKNGEVHIKAVRDESGSLTGLVELSTAEYDALTIEMDALKSDIETQMDEMHVNMKARMDEMRSHMNIKERMQNGTFERGEFESSFKEARESMQRQMGEMRANMKAQMDEMPQRLMDALNKAN